MSHVLDNSSNNGSDLDKSNILKPTFDTLMEEGRKAFKAYHAKLEELFLSRCEVTWQGTILQDTTLIVFNRPEVTSEVQPEPSPSRNDIQSKINSELGRQAKSTDELLRRLIEEQDGKKLDATCVNSFSSTYVVSFTQTNPHTSGASAGGTIRSNPSANPMNHFHSRTTIEGSTPTFRASQQTTANMFGQGYTQTTPSFSMSYFTSAPYTPGGNGRAYAHASGNYQPPYTTVADIDHIPLPGSSLGFLPNHAYQTAPRFNAYSQPEADSFGYETPPQFLFRPQSIDMMPA
jgi:hypothetical protein